MEVRQGYQNGIRILTAFGDIAGKATYHIPTFVYEALNRLGVTEWSSKDNTHNEQEAS